MELIRKETNGTVGMKWCQVGLSVMVVLSVQMIVLIGMIFEMVVVVAVVVVAVVVAMHVAVFCMIVVRVVCRWWEATINWLSTKGATQRDKKQKVDNRTFSMWLRMCVCVGGCLVCSTYIIDVCR